LACVPPTIRDIAGFIPHEPGGLVGGAGVCGGLVGGAGVCGGLVGGAGVCGGLVGGGGVCGGGGDGGTPPHAPFVTVIESMAMSPVYELPAIPSMTTFWFPFKVTDAFCQAFP